MVSESSVITEYQRNASRIRSLPLRQKYFGFTTKKQPAFCPSLEGISLYKECDKIHLLYAQPFTLEFSIYESLRTKPH